MRWWKEERGNAMLLTLGTVAIMAIMLIIVANFSKVFIVKEIASSTAEQASLVAAAIVVEKVKEEIEEYEDTLKGKLEDLLDESLTEKIEKRKQAIQHETNWLKHELEIRAMNDVLTEELKAGNNELRVFLLKAMQRATNEIPSIVENNIKANNGKVNGTIISINENNRLQVETHVEYSMMKLDKYVPGDKQQVKQKSESPSLSFFRELGYNGWKYEFR